MKVSWADVNNTETPGAVSAFGWHCKSRTAEHRHLEIQANGPVYRNPIHGDRRWSGAARFGGLTMYRMRTFSAAAKAKGK
jgi:hypothetical protein